jgi:unspecific monooxygenase
MTIRTLTRQDAPIPHQRFRLPLLGDIYRMRPRTTVQSAMRLGGELGPVFERKFLGLRVVFVSDADIVAELSDESRFTKMVLPFLARLRGLGGDALFTAYNDEPNWSRAHNLLRPAFAQSAMRGYHRTMLDTAGELIGHWDGLAGRASVDVPGDMTKLTLETIGRAGFSFSFDALRREQTHPFVTAMVQSLAYAPLRTMLSVPLAGDLLMRRADRRDHARQDYLFSVVDEVIAERRAHGHTGPDDLLELMMRAARENDPNRLDERNIRHQIITFLVAGHETTSGALSFALYYLARHPEVAARARAEVDEVWGRAETPEFEQVAKLRYVRRVLDESLRLWPTAPVYARQPREQTIVAGKYRMSPGDGMSVLIPMLHRAPEWGPNPELFDPDRFEPDRVRNRGPHLFKPFGTGERACIGRQFAIHEAVIALACILRRYELALEPGYRLRVAERLTLMPKDFRLNLRARC